MSPKQLDEVKNQVQKILDKYLPVEQGFSVQNLNEESVFLLIDLLLEKDDLERWRIRFKIQEKIRENQMNIELDHEKILKIRDKLSYLKENHFQNLNDLKNIVNVDSELDNQLDNI